MIGVTHILFILFEIGTLQRSRCIDKSKYVTGSILDVKFIFLSRLNAAEKYAPIFFSFFRKA